MKFRIEKDSIGEVQLPAEVYYGINTYRASMNFNITKRGICRQMIKSLAIVKKAAAKANLDAENLDKKRADAIMRACDEILNGKLHGQFITDLIQGGAGTSINMNANEVIANRANEILGGKKGTYEFVHPFDHVDMCQSTNDVIPTAGKIAIIKQIKKLIVELKKLRDTLLLKSVEFKDVIKMGRTHLNEAVPITLGQELEAYASVLTRDLKKLDQAIDELSEVNLGGTNIGTGINTSEKYAKKVIFYLNKFSGEKIVASKNLIDATQNLDAFTFASSVIKNLAINMSKMASDFRIMASSPVQEIFLPLVQQGASNMPGKYNPVIPEVVNQVAFYVMGLDVTISKAVEAAQLELNVFQPVILMSMFDELTNLRHAIRTFNELCVQDMKANIEKCRDEVEQSTAIIAALSPHLGYEITWMVASEARQRNVSIKQVILEKELMNEEKLNLILDIDNMTNPGILGEELLKNK